MARAQAAPNGVELVDWLLAGKSTAQAVAALEEEWAKKQIQPVGGRTAIEIITRLRRRIDAARAPRLTSAQAELIARYAACKGAPRETLVQLKTLAGGMAFTGAVDGWTERLDVLVADGLPEDRMSFDAGFGRAFSYYDGFLFEVTSTAMGDDAPVAAGGRYDSLLGRLSGVPGSAVGCIVRPARAWVGGPT
jgi:ATP phosphoribosyltransferase regulatory subunit